MKQKIYIIHGWTYNLDKWTDFCTQLKQDGYEPVQLRVPGLTTKDKQAFRMADYVDWLDEQIGREKGEVIVLAHSNGGRIVLHYLLQHPGKIKKLILVDSAGVEPTIAALKRREVLGSLSSLVKKFKVPLRLRWAAYKFLRATDYDNAPANMKITMQNMLESDIDFNASIATIKIDAMLIWGVADQLTPLEQGKKMAELLDAPLHVIHGARHAPFATHPKKVATLVEEFIS